MKIKKFNDSNDKNFWMVRTDKTYLEISLNKLGCPKSIIDIYITNSRLLRETKIYVGNESDDFGWEEGNSAGKKYFKITGFHYQGEIKITNQDILEYKMNKDTNKFNL